MGAADDGRRRNAGTSDRRADAVSRPESGAREDEGEDGEGQDLGEGVPTRATGSSNECSVMILFDVGVNLLAIADALVLFDVSGFVLFLRSRPRHHD